MTPQRLPIFPLQTVVLFPRVQTPLHLFEARYRQLAEHALAGDHSIGMVTVLPDRVADMPGDPEVFPVGCAGIITESQRLPDGRYNIVLLGTHRIRILNEPERPPDQLFRTAEVERLEDVLSDSDAGRVAILRAEVMERVSDLVRRSHPESDPRVGPDLFRDVDDTAFVNALANAFPFDVREKQGLLEADSVVERFQRLAAVLRFLQAEPEGAKPPDSGALH